MEPRPELTEEENARLYRSALCLAGDLHSLPRPKAESIAYPLIYGPALAEHLLNPGNLSFAKWEVESEREADLRARALVDPEGVAEIIMREAEIRGLMRVLPTSGPTSNL